MWGGGGVDTLFNLGHIPMHSTVPSSSRLPFGGLSRFPGAHAFGGLSSFLRDAIADEDSRILSDGMQALALQAESAVAGLRISRRRDHAAPLLMDLLTGLREHRGMVANLGLAWRELYEYGAYLQALNGLHVLIGQWLLHADPRDDEVGVTAEEVARIAWRTLGEGVLLVDMYEQWLEREDLDDGDAGPAQGEDPQDELSLTWWQRLRR